MSKDKTSSNEDKVNLIKEVANKAIIDIGKIKKKRDDRIRKILKDIDNKHIEETLQDIKNLK